MAEILLILEDQIRRYGGRYGVRDLALLSSALALPTATYEGKLLHEDVFDQAAAYLFHICQNHPFLDGNKRTALAAALVFLDINGIELLDDAGALYRITMDVAGGRMKKDELAKALRDLWANQPS